jgi:hypothetical protein
MVLVASTAQDRGGFIEVDDPGKVSEGLRPRKAN